MAKILQESKEENAKGLISICALSGQGTVAVMEK